MVNRAALFDAVRAPLFGGRLDAGHVNGIAAILDAWHGHGSGEPGQLAYVLATAFHETGRTMQPVREAYGTSDGDTIRRLDAAWKAGQLTWVSKPYWRSGWFGRGYVQITHKDNYERLGKRLGIDLAGNRDLALKSDIAAQILVVGMVEGLFTGKSLSDYIGRTRCDFRNARRIVNGTDRAAQIAGYAEQFKAAIEAADIPGPPDVAPIPDPDLDMRPLPEDRSALQRIGGAIALGLTAATAWVSENPEVVIGGVAIAGAIIAFIFWRNRT